MADKAVNYTDEMVARMQGVYDSEASDEARDVQVAQLAEELGKSAASIRAKLANVGIYVAKAKVEGGKNTVRKADLVAAIAEKIGADEDVVGSLEKANKAALTRVLNAL